MTCECGYADECDGETAIFYPLQDGGMCSVRDCYRREDEMQGEWRDVPLKENI
jgi:hypothetical protein